MLAAANGHHACVSLLLSQGCSVLANDIFHRTALHGAVSSYFLSLTERGFLLSGYLYRSLDIIPASPSSKQYLITNIFIFSQQMVMKNVLILY